MSCGSTQVVAQEKRWPPSGPTFATYLHAGAGLQCLPCDHVLCGLPSCLIDKWLILLWFGFPQSSPACHMRGVYTMSSPHDAFSAGPHSGEDVENLSGVSSLFLHLQSQTLSRQNVQQGSRDIAQVPHQLHGWPCLHRKPLLQL